MRKFTKSLLTLALLVVSAVSANAEKLYSDFSEIGEGGGASWNAETKTMGWSASWSNAVAYFMIKGIDKTGDYYDLSSWETITVTFSLTGTTNGVRIRMKDPSGDGGWILMPEGTNTIKITDFKKSDNTTSLDYTKIVGIQLSGGNPTSAASTATFTELYLERPDDPLAIPKDNLSKAISLGNLQNSFAKTTASWNALQNAISDGQTEYANPSATVESLNAATQAIAFAIAGLKLQDGYTNLTKAMANANVDYTLNSSTGLPYGTSTVDMNTYAELNEFDQFIVLAATGKPRFCMNRLTADGQIGDDLEQSKMIDINPNNDKTWATEKYQTIDENKYTLDLKKIAADWNGLARLNCIKGANYANVTVTDMLLYRTITVDDAGYATFGSVSKNAKPNGVKAYAAKVNGTKVELTEVTNVPAGKGVVIEASAGSYAPTFDVDADDIESELLVSNGTVVGDGTIYVLANKNSVPGFYKLANDQKVPAGKAYLKVTSQSAPEFLPFEGNTTGIESVKSVESKGQFFNLAGQRVAQPAKGLYIVNGKKVIFK
jgi:hypothetical protein